MGVLIVSTKRVGWPLLKSSPLHLEDMPEYLQFAVHQLEDEEVRPSIEVPALNKPE